MRLATLGDGSRDGTLIVVDRAGQTFARAGAAAPTLQRALDEWSRCEPLLRQLAYDLERGTVKREELDVAALLAPLPRAYEWVDGSAYLNHIVLARSARGAEPPPDLKSEPLVYQGGSGVLLGPTAPLELTAAAAGLDFEAEIVVFLGDVPRGVTAGSAAPYIRLIGLANDVTYRGMIPHELSKGFGFFLSKPATAFAPFAVTPDVLGGRFRDGRAFLRIACTYNGALIGEPNAGEEMHFSFYDLLAHITRTRSFTAGTILGGGTVSNRTPERGVACLVERRSREILASGNATTPYMQPGDTLRIEAFGDGESTVFGAIDQRVIARP